MWRRLVRRITYTDSEGRVISFWQRVKKNYKGVLKEWTYNTAKQKIPSINKNINKEIQQKYSSNLEESIEHMSNVLASFTNIFFEDSLIIDSTNGLGIVRIPQLKKNDFVLVTPLTPSFSPYVFKNAGEYGYPKNVPVGIGFVKVYDGYIKIYSDTLIEYTYRSGGDGSIEIPRKVTSLAYSFVQITIIPNCKEV